MEDGKVILTVVRQRPISTFEKKKGEGVTTLYEVEAVDENGEVVSEALRSFAELQIGEAIEYDVSRYEHPRHGISWTVQKPRENTSRRVAGLEKRVQDLEDRLSRVERA